MKELTPAERLIVAADFKPDPNATLRSSRSQVFAKVVALAQSLKGTGVYLKMNSALRAHGYDLIDMIHDLGLRVFADLKLFDIGETLGNDGLLLAEAQPEILTVACMTGVKAVRALKTALPNTEVLGVTVLTSIDDEECKLFYRQDNVADNVQMLAAVASVSGLDGIICSPKETGIVQKVIRDDMTINTPGVRPLWIEVKGDDQNKERVMTPADAIRAGVSRIVMGRPIVQAPSPYDAVMRTIDEIASVTA